MDPLSLGVKYVLLEKLFVLKDMLVFLEIRLVLAKMFIALHSLRGKWTQPSRTQLKQYESPKDERQTHCSPPPLPGTRLTGHI